MKREAGILMPISALPSEYGIGCFSSEAYAFADLLEKSGQRVWQILPLCPTSYGDSPYQSPCSFAGNPYLIDPDTLAREGLLTNEEIILHSATTKCARVNYGDLYESRYPLLYKAYERFLLRSGDDGYEKFLVENSFWIEDYALFSAIKKHFHNKPISEWQTDILLRLPSAMEEYRQKLSYEIGFVKFLQYKFFSQWYALKRYANDKGIKILGDIPIYVSADSSDLWRDPSLFLLDGSKRPLCVAGCPPDDFSAKGQLWGNPIYNWDANEKEGFAWWKKRMSHGLKMYDMIRIDHFRGFEAYYSIPYGAEDATGGHWERGVGYKLFEKVIDKEDRHKIIAEDLGYMTDGVRELVSLCGFAGMKILQFGFDENDKLFSSEYLPHNYPQNSVVYTGTHDNPTITQWLYELSPEKEGALRRYTVDFSTPKEELSHKLIALAMQSPSFLCIIPLQDYLEVGKDGRMNVPSEKSGNWSWRVKREHLHDGLCQKIRYLTSLGGRLTNPV